MSEESENKRSRFWITQPLLLLCRERHLLASMSDLVRSCERFLMVRLRVGILRYLCCELYRPLYHCAFNFRKRVFGNSLWILAYPCSPSRVLVILINWHLLSLFEYILYFPNLYTIIYCSFYLKFAVFSSNLSFLGMSCQFVFCFFVFRDIATQSWSRQILIILYKVNSLIRYVARI